MLRRVQDEEGRDWSGMSQGRGWRGQGWPEGAGAGCAGWAALLLTCPNNAKDRKRMAEGW